MYHFLSKDTEFKRNFTDHYGGSTFSDDFKLILHNCSSVAITHVILNFLFSGNQRPYFITSSVFYAFRGKALKVQLRAFDPENRDIRYSFGKNEITGASLTERGLFTWPRVTTNASLFVFNVTDECGEYSLLNANVIIKECPCKNSGDCVPDEQDLDGKGKFTCLCSSQYTGSLCKEDANECVVSKPCGNGSCVNQQPGFLCSCFSGYTGNLCETEVFWL